ncbi:MAG: IS21 family transposase [bacterium]|nr:IS21 family transposase [bacterium]
MSLLNKEETLKIASAKAGMSERTARKYVKLDKLPSQTKVVRTWRTRENPFSRDWDWIEEQLESNTGLEAKTLFVALQSQYPGRYSDGQLRTLQRQIKAWRALSGPGKEVFFPQLYRPGEWSCSDFTRMGKLGITISGSPFPHMIYHFVLNYSNWETGVLCYSESFESFSQGLQAGFWKLGGVTKHHRTDSLSAAVNNLSDPKEFTQRYQNLCRHYGFKAAKTQPNSPHENGDAEQSHHRFKRAIEQALMLRGHKDFPDIQSYQEFLNKMFDQLNSGRRERFQEELAVLKELPERRLEDYQDISVKVAAGSTIRVRNNTYSVNSRLLREKVRVRIYSEHLEVWYAQQKVDHFPRLRGRKKARIDYRHIIDSLIEKPGAFENYRYRDFLFPSSHFRMAYDWLTANKPHRQAVRDYLAVLKLAADETEWIVEKALQKLLADGQPISIIDIRSRISSQEDCNDVYSVEVKPVNLADYDELLLENFGEADHGEA